MKRSLKSYSINIISIVLILFTLAHSAKTFSQESSDILVDQYALEFLDNNDQQIRLYYDLLDFNEKILIPTSDIKALGPIQLEQFYSLIKNLLKNDRERSYLELKLRVLSDLSIGERFYSNDSTKSFTLNWAATELVGKNMFDHIFSDIYESKKLRRLILSDTNDLGLRKEKVNQYVKKYHQQKKQKRLKKFLKNFMANKDKIRSAITDSNDIYLYELIIELENNLKLHTQNLSRNRWERIKYKLQYFSDVISINANETFSDISGGFGNLVGAIKWRKGYLSKNEKAISLIKSTLEPLDILVEKTPFILTDYFIPGHFGHVALYLGTADQIQNLGLWDHPSIKNHQKSILDGKVILEAKREGVKLSTLEEFLNVDEVAILRTSNHRKNILKYNLKDVFIRSVSQIGKSYDFNFDVESSNEIVCSELIYQSYYYIDWNIERTMGRWTISPDNIVQNIFQPNPSIDLVLYIKGYIANTYKKLGKKNLERKIK